MCSVFPEYEQEFDQFLVNISIFQTKMINDSVRKMWYHEALINRTPFMPFNLKTMIEHRRL